MRTWVSWLVGALLLACGGQAHAGWQEAKSKHFIIYANESAEEIRAYADKLERFDQAVRYIRGMDDPPLTDAGRVTIFVLPNDDAMMKLTRTYYIRGFYVPRASGSYAFVPRKSGMTMIQGASGGTGTYKDSLDGESVFFHEYAHHLQLQDWTGVMPTWVSEGFAEFFATADVAKNGNVTIGKFPAYRSWEVFLGGGFSAEELVSADYEKLNYYEVAALYGRSWLLTHYLTASSQRKGQLSRYLDGIEKGVSARDSAKAAFGDLKALNRDLEDYIKPRSLIAFTVDAKVIPIGDVAVRQLGASAAAMMDVVMRSKSEMHEKTAPDVAAAARRAAGPFPNDAFAQGALAEAEYDAKNYEAAEAAADRALATDPGNVQALIYKGRAQMKLAAKDADHADWDKVRSWFSRANRLDTENAEPLMLFYESYREAKQAPSKNAVEALLYAADLAPRDLNLRLQTVGALLAENRIAEARERFVPAAYAPHAEKEWRASAMEVMKAIDSGDSKLALDLLIKANEKQEAKRKNS